MCKPMLRRFRRLWWRVLRQRAADPATFAAARFNQVQQVNRQQTWAHRAGQWEQAVLLWNQRRRGELSAATPLAAAGSAAPAATRLTVPAALELARQHAAAGRTAAAEAVARAVLQSAAENVEAHRLLGSLAYQQGARGPAAEHLQTARLEAGQSGPLLQLGRRFVALGPAGRSGRGLPAGPGVGSQLRHGLVQPGQRLVEPWPR